MESPRQPIVLFIQIVNCALPIDFPKVLGDIPALLVVVNHLLFLISKDVIQLVTFSSS